MKALSKEEIEQVYEDLILYLDSVPINALLSATWVEAHYIPLLLSPEFKNIITQIKKMHGIRIYPINISLLNNVVKQVIFRSSSGYLITVQLCYCNLLYEQVDAIVNHCRELSEDILVIGGQALKLELDEYIARHQVDPATNVCICCGSGYLPCKKVIHVFSSPTEEAFCSLQRALKCAQEHNLRVISFPSTGKDLLSAEKLMHEIQLFFIQNPNSCVHTIRIVCNSVQLINAYKGIKEFRCKEGILDLPESQPPLTPTNHIFCQWYWQADDGTFIPYTNPTNSTLTCTYEANSTGECYFNIGSNTYKADFAQMKQINLSTYFVRNIKLEHLQQNGHTGTVSVNNVEVEISVKWFHHSENQDHIPFSLADSSRIEDLYFSCLKSPMLRQGSKHFSLGFKVMVSQNASFSQVMPSKTTNLSRKVLVHQPRSSQCLQPFPRWYYTDDTKQFVPYSIDDSASIENMYQSKAHGEKKLSINSRTYKFNFDDMKQINAVTGYRRRIKRVLESIVPHHHYCRGLVMHVEGPSEKVAKATEELKTKLESMLYTMEFPLPSTLSSWSCEYCRKRILNLLKKYNILYSTSESMPAVSTAISSTESEVIKLQGIKNLIQTATIEIMEEIALAINDSAHLQIPAEWEPQTYNLKLFKLCKQADEYNHIKCMFQSTMPTSSIVSIMRIQNIWLWERYVITRNRMCKKNNGMVNEKLLFHGSRCSQAFDIYSSEEGFDMRFSGEGMWGLANYFAENASYSNSYANENGDGTKEMFVAKVLTGDRCKCSSDKTLRLPPLKNNLACFHHERYDTVEGQTNGSKVYMTYSNDKAYPAYLIVYYPHYHTCLLQPSSPQQYPSSSWIYSSMQSNPMSLTLPHGTSTTSQQSPPTSMI